jgi:hypothetical protein
MIAMTNDEKLKRIQRVAINFKGDFAELESAIGMLILGDIVGWKVLYLIHSRSTIRNYERILGNINIREEFPAETKHSSKSVAYRLVQEISNFWKAVKGEIPGIRTSQIE